MRRGAMVVTVQISRCNTMECTSARCTNGGKKNFHFLLELTVINANIIHNTKRLAVGMKKLELVNFKNMLIQQLTEAACIEEDRKAPKETWVPVQALQLSPAREKTR
ncbi:hypothetical protein RRG08_058440 [Elysia crispata]|uniref:Uncharacterized protein n=1 Tax=Elysia crispata TaxID=231223 RepID=A0AAE0Y0D4_9GAST|nr:hypothetical protein RRG08_058440 [Elysia crispata]